MPGGRRIWNGSPVSFPLSQDPEGALTTMRNSFVAAALLALAASRSPAGDWPQWRGPDRNGVVDRSPPLVSRLSGSAWRTEGLPSGEEGGRGSLSVAGGRVYGLTR